MKLEVCEGVRTLDKWSFLIAIKFKIRRSELAVIASHVRENFIKKIWNIQSNCNFLHFRMAVTGTVVIYLLLISLLQKTLQAKSFLYPANSQSQRTAENVSQNLKYSQIEPLIAKVINSEWTDERINEIAERTVEKIAQLLKNGWTEQSRPEVDDRSGNYGVKEEERDKRLMGIFRCTGWGPGCTPLSGKMGRNAKGRSKFRQVDVQMYRSGGQVKGSTNSGGGGGGGGQINHRGRTRNKFQPFFTLTSGKSISLCLFWLVVYLFVMFVKPTNQCSTSFQPLSVKQANHNSDLRLGLEFVTRESSYRHKLMLVYFKASREIRTQLQLVMYNIGTMGVHKWCDIEESDFN